MAPAIDVPYHYEHAPRVVQNIRVESQNNWYLGAHRVTTEIVPLREAQTMEPLPEWEVLPAAKGKPYVLRPVKKAKHKSHERPYCLGEPSDAKDCLVPK